MDAPNPAFADTLRRAVLAMPMAQSVGLRFARIAAGEVDVEIPYRDELSFRPGQMQATAIFAAADFAAVAAAGTLLPPGWINASIDCTLKIVGPANGEKLLAKGRVVNAGKLITVSAAEVYSVRDGQQTLCATALATARNIEPKH
ncbi:hotdog fold thioesterase [Noviherbaspirillum sp.]|uniref:PaaI family thioesterase n=1 Tax=Noviherbaspirillum sp. TaxID=1926288 RepID=UPI002D3FC644|nr:hotdog fold thioesterase [Noviherbaspirillum sp.]HZW19917.1 hotdog fold thioesterase [Noviherbaspirillum sp.]